MEKKYSNLRSGVVLLALSLAAYFWLIPTQIRYRGDAAIGPSFFPKILVIFCGICAGILIFQGAWGLMKTGSLGKALRDRSLRIDWKLYTRHAIFLASAVAYMAVMPWLGFIAASILFLTFLLRFFGHPKLGTSLLMSVLYVAAIYVVFSVAFKISFPKNLLGF